jgi:hypothetical protein
VAGVRAQLLEFDLETGPSWALLFDLDDDARQALPLKSAKGDGVVRAVR